ncbi:LAFA_0G13916g1_1 [Lachancea sp. 'fantastica']|nr:LAFA_0G13916g1_1 [Lachancea sp. 'fantastica']
MLTRTLTDLTRTSLTRFNSALVGNCAKRSFHHSASALGYKKWADLGIKDKQTFINKYIELYKEKHPCSPSNTMHRNLVSEMEEYEDAPYVFGIVYNEIRSLAQGESVHNVEGSGVLGDPEFQKLLLD